VLVEDIRDLITNTFAWDWAHEDSLYWPIWRSVSESNSVSPDNMMLWDSPGPDNQNQFRSVYKT
jgi:hypothetical protein